MDWNQLMKIRDKYALYQAAVQDPVEDVRIYSSMYESLRGHAPRVVREDFCGTFLFSRAWVKSNPKNIALGLDLDPEPLAYGKKYHLVGLSTAEKRRLKIMKKNVMSVTTPKADLIVANNFSFFIFKERKALIRYFSFARRSLAKGGLFVLELAGGAEMIQKGREQRVVVPDVGEKYTYVWDQRTFNPINNNGIYAIHFQFESEPRIFRDAFVYDWRLWSVAEVRECMLEAGFPKTKVFWEKYALGEPTGHYVHGEVMPNDSFYLAYVAGEI